MYKTLSEAAIKEYIGHRVERMSVIKKGDTMIVLKDQTRIMEPHLIRRKLMDREHLAHTGINGIQMSIRAKYFWPGIEGEVKRLVEACEPCQLHNRAQRRDRHRPALKYVNRLMRAVGIYFF